MCITIGGDADRRRLEVPHAILITEPKDGSILPADTREMRVTGIVSLAGVSEVVVLNNYERVAVVDGRFAFTMKLGGAQTTVAVQLVEPGDHYRLDHIDRINVCRAGTVPAN